MSLNAGHFNKPIIFQKRNEGVSETGMPLTGYVDVNKDSAMVKNVSAKEYVDAKTNQNEKVVRFVVRYRKAYMSDDMYDYVIDYKGKKFEIESVINDDERDTTLTIVGRVVS
jgi:SPP1 family predicted phage head-tail adaptor